MTFNVIVAIMIVIIVVIIVVNVNDVNVIVVLTLMFLLWSLVPAVCLICIWNQFFWTEVASAIPGIQWNLVDKSHPEINFHSSSPPQFGEKPWGRLFELFSWFLVAGWRTCYCCKYYLLHSSSCPCCLFYCKPL